MKINLVTVTMFTVGVVLIYSAVKDKDPRDVVKLTLGNKSPAGATAVPSSAPKSNPSPTPIPNAPTPGTGPVISI